MVATGHDIHNGNYPCSQRTCRIANKYLIINYDKCSKGKEQDTVTENHKGHITLDQAEKMMEKSQLSKGSGARRNIAARGMTYAKVLRQEIPQNMRGIRPA